MAAPVNPRISTKRVLKNNRMQPGKVGAMETSAVRFAEADSPVRLESATSVKDAGFKALHSGCTEIAGPYLDCTKIDTDHGWILKNSCS
jgi:hypothetical protein